MPSLLLRALFCLGAASALIACSDDDSDGQTDESTADAGSDLGNDAATGADTDDGSGFPFEPSTPLTQATRDLGLDRYLGTLPPPTVEATAGAETTWVWGTDDGPLCMRGDAFRFSTRAADPERLIFFLQGGGACWDDFCLAVIRAPAGVPAVDVLNLDLEANPLKDWSVAYLPYCDGSMFAGDRDHDDDGDGAPERFHRGLQNLSGALQTTREQFPAPRQVLLTGSSAGGFGTIIATLLVRATWPDAELLVFNDSGVGVARDGEPEFIGHLIDQFGLTDSVPADCTECITSGHISPMIGWTLERDPNIRVAVFSSWYDSIIGDIFLAGDPEVFRAALEAQTGDLHERFPDQYRRFIVDGKTHTTLLGDPSGVIGSDLTALELPRGFLSRLQTVEIGTIDGTRIGDVRMADWLTAFVENSDAWQDLLEPATESPWQPTPPAP
jgi:hypothetical protein